MLIILRHTIPLAVFRVKSNHPGRGRKALKKSQHWYLAYMGDIFGACYFIEKLKYFLQLQKFILRVDCKALKWLRTQDQTPPGMVLRWLKVLVFLVGQTPQKLVTQRTRVHWPTSRPAVMILPFLSAKPNEVRLPCTLSQCPTRLGSNCSTCANLIWQLSLWQILR